MTRQRLVPLLLLLLCGLFLAGGVGAANGLAVERSVIGGGGERVTDGSLYILQGTLGEPVASGIVLEAGYGLGSGFWWPREFKVYLPLALRDYS
jgi:hypothetical protein